MDNFPVIRWEINARDPKGLQSFYSRLFGWKITSPYPEYPYGMVDTGSEGMGGGIGPEPHYGTRIYVSVTDIASILEQARMLGATYAEGPKEIGGLILGVFDDAEGNRIGLIQRDGTLP